MQPLVEEPVPPAGGMHHTGSVRLTVAQAVVRYLASQWSERDGSRRRAVPGIFGIFGHGNVCGIGPALEEDAGRSLSFHQPKNEQARMNSRDLATVSRREGRPAELLLREHLERRVPARRLGTPDEVAGLFAFLASDEAGFITGEVIRIDGGELAG